MTEVQRTVTFDEDMVRAWCDQAGDSNQIHLDEQAAADSTFGQRIVPGVMVLDQVSGLLWQYGEVEGKTTILANLVACRFRDPIPFDEEVTITLEEAGDDNRFQYLDFEARVNGTLAVHGSASVVLE